MIGVFSFVSRVPLGASTRSFDSFDLRECYTMHSALLTCALRCSLVRGLVSVWPSVMVGLCWPLAFAWSTQTRNCLGWVVLYWAGSCSSSSSSSNSAVSSVSPTPVLIARAAALFIIIPPDCRSFVLRAQGLFFFSVYSEGGMPGGALCEVRTGTPTH